MRTISKAILLLVVVSAIAPLAMAQWPAFPSPNVPKNADGKPNLVGPTPRTADGKPDLSGIWGRGGGQGLAPGGGQRGAAADGQRGQGGGRGAAPAGPPPVPPLPPDGIPIATFGNAGQGLKEDLPF